MVIATTRTIARIQHLRTFLADSPHAVLGWGRKSSGQRAIRLARLLRRPFTLLEDGFLRSVDRDAPPLSLLLDDLGIYYDASSPSRMEEAIAAGTSLDEAARARHLIAAWRSGHVSKYNHAPDYAAALPDRYVLVVDQTFGDLSVAGGLADGTSFATMLEAARAENPGHRVLVKVHPDVIKRGKRGYFPLEALAMPDVQVIGEDCHPARLLEESQAVYAVTSLMGFEALIWGKRVRCFGMPFYAGWGLTEDVLPRPPRRGRATIEDLVHAALVCRARYADPVTGIPWEAEQAIAYIAEGRRVEPASSPLVSA